MISKPDSPLLTSTKCDQIIEIKESMNQDEEMQEAPELKNAPAANYINHRVDLLQKSPPDPHDGQDVSTKNNAERIDMKEPKKDSIKDSKSQKIVFSTARHHKYPKKLHKRAKPTGRTTIGSHPEAKKKDPEEEKLLTKKHTRESLKIFLDTNAKRVAEHKATKEKQIAQKKKKEKARSAAKKKGKEKAQSAHDKVQKTHEVMGQDDVLDISPSENDLNLEPPSTPPKPKSQIYQGRNLALSKK